MKHKHLTLVLAVLMSIVCNVIWAHNHVYGNIYYDIFNPNTSTTASVTYRGTDSSQFSDEYTGTVIIPNIIKFDGKTYTVTSIGSYAFAGCTRLTSVTIPNSVTSIGDYAFSGCSGLTSITIPSSVTSIYSKAFRGCSGLTSITIPSSVTSIGSEAFDDCNGLTSVTINSNTIASKAYTTSSTLAGIFGSQVKNYIWGDNIQSIGDYACYGCSGLTDVTIPNSVTSVGSQAFYGTAWYNNQPNGLVYAGKVAYKYKGTMPENTNIILEEGTLSIAGSAFSGCSGLTSITIPNSVTSIGDYAFSGCSGLTSITIPSSVTSISSHAFDGCSGLTSVTINSNTIASKTCTTSSTLAGIFGSQVTNYIFGDDVKGIGEYACYGCNGLTSITIPNSVTSIGSQAFYGTVWYDNQPDGLVYAGKVAYKYKGTMSENTDIILEEGTLGIAGSAFRDCTNLTSITIPDSVISIGDYAFYACNALTTITIPNSVASIGSAAFHGCSGLTTVTINSNTIASNTYTKLSTLVGIFGTQVKKYIFGENVQSIGDYACYGCGGLTSITIHNRVTSIGSNAFNNCSSLTLVTINSNTIVSKAYSSSSSFAKIFGSQVTNYVFGDNVQRIGANACYNCSKLTSVTIPSSVTSIGEYAFSGCTNLNYITIPENVASIGEYAFSGCTNLNHITIPESVASIGYGAFYNCKGLTKAEFASVEKLCGIAFGNFSANPLNYAHHLYINGNEVTELVIPNSVNSIGNYAFSGCSEVTSVTIPDSVTSISYGAFSGCNGLTFITIPNSVTLIGNGAFQNCSGLTLVTINSNDVVSKSQLSNIFGTQVSTYVLSDEVECIGDYAFSGCSGMTSVTIPNSVTSIGNSAFYGCSGLPSITIPNNVTSINNYTFYGCTSLSSIAISENVSSIGDYAFSGCSVLTSVEFPNNVTSIGSSAFYGCSDLPSITIPNKVSSIGSLAFQNCSGLTSVSIPNNVTSIGASAFYNCKGLTSVTVGNGVASIGDRAFEGCSGIERLDVDCKEIKKNDFSACKANLKEVNIGTNVENIEKDTFKDFTSLQRCSFGSVEGLLNIRFGNAAANPLSITKTLNVDSKVVTELVIPESVTAINDYALYNCNSVKKMIGGGHVTSIGKYAFYNSAKLSSIQIGKNVETIGDYAFNGCPLTNIYNYAEYPQNYNSNVFSIVKENCNLYVLPECVDMYKVHQDWYEFDIQSMDEEVNVTLSASGYATYYNSMDSYSLPSELVAKVVTGVEGNRIIYQTIADGAQSNNVVPAGVAVMLESKGKQGGTYTLTLSVSDDVYAGTNLLEGSDVATNVQPMEDEYVYKLSYGPSNSDYSNVFGWYWGAANGGAFDITAHKAWLTLKKTNAVKEYLFDDEITGIEDFGNETPKRQTIYDLQGRKVYQPNRKGIFIVNGKKIVRK